LGTAEILRVIGWKRGEILAQQFGPFRKTTFGFSFLLACRRQEGSGGGGESESSSLRLLKRKGSV